ncbi:MAG: hypothetical protein EZS28_015027 [Streblomastix strix]|uniref:Protein kinase domain-containing protein n=1 Tax=Streblomastix strix TaxID=222440 RepID=A0A5J4W3P4_9EUKA|nr:MAG: hypothetical protein EZS28_015027 [Streblomastix strix]
MVLLELYDLNYGIVANKIVLLKKFDNREWESAVNIGIDIKCSNILLHNPPGTELVHAKISDFGFAQKEDKIHGQTCFAGTLPFMSPEQFHKSAFITQKVDIYALGITFYNIIVHKYPVNQPTIEKYQEYFNNPQFDKTKLKQPQEIKDNILWDLLQNLLEFDPNKRISAAEALQHPYFTSSEAIADVSKEQLNISNQCIINYYSGSLRYKGKIKEGKPNPLLKEMERDGTLTKLIEIFNNDQFNNKEIKTQAACSIGQLYKATQLPSEIGFKIFVHLKDNIIRDNSSLSTRSLPSLICLAEYQCMHKNLL